MSECITDLNLASTPHPLTTEEGEGGGVFKHAATNVCGYNKRLHFIVMYQERKRNCLFLNARKHKRELAPLYTRTFEYLIPGCFTVRGNMCR